MHHRVQPRLCHQTPSENMIHFSHGRKTLSVKLGSTAIGSSTICDYAKTSCETRAGMHMAMGTNKFYNFC